ncbi:MAG: type IV secretion system DNA-binding domain-containing protein [Clostridia bacterium]|nr:type IV secretion system DNA-binding domain-containing protein [Clostridia bacterium]MDD4386522.1 type IV secretion system DNA-binding domain-containing protein [Clostridia bacterium]
MFLFLEFFIYLLFLFFKLYSLLDKIFFFTSQGSKLDNYIKKKNLLNIASNLGSCNNINLLNLKSPIWYKHMIYSLLVSVNIIAIKIAFTYNFLSCSFYNINIFGKQIDLVSSFGIYFNIFKFIYYISFSFFIIYISYYIISKQDKLKKEITIDNTDKMYLGLDESQNYVYLSKEGLYQNILITGSIGSGKTSSGITNILDYFIKSNIYGLILDVKGNYNIVVDEVAEKYSKQTNIVQISLNSSFNYNPLDKPCIKPLEIAHTVRKVLTLISDNNTSDSYWLDKVESYIKDFITLIRVYNEYVNFSEIHKLVIDKVYLNTTLSKIKNIILKNTFKDDRLFEINSSLSNIQNEYLNLDERTSSIIRSEITRITDLFVSDYNINKKFCSRSDKLDFSADNIYVLSISIADNKKLAKVISTYLKLDFQKQILSFNCKPTFFICDEYQEFSNVEDANFFSLSREFKCINVISMQSYTSLNNSLNNTNAAKVIIQNLVNKIWFRNDDIYTVEEIIKQIGKEEKDKLSINLNEASKETKYSIFTNKFKNIKSNLSEGYTVTKSFENTLDSSYFTTKLKTFETVCILSDGSSSKLYKKVKFKRWTK